MDTPKNRGGRPRTTPPPTTGDFIGFRVPASLKRDLESAATAAGRSLSSEAVVRMEASFRHDRGIMDALTFAYGPRIAATVVLVADAMKMAIERPTMSLTKVSDAWRLEQAIRAARAVLQFFRPRQVTPPAVVPSADDADLDLDRHIGVESAGLRLGRLAGPGYDPVRAVVPDDWLRLVAQEPGGPDLPREDKD